MKSSPLSIALAVGLLTLGACTTTGSEAETAELSFPSKTFSGTWDGAAPSTLHFLAQATCATASVMSAPLVLIPAARLVRWSSTGVETSSPSLKPVLAIEVRSLAAMVRDHRCECGSK